MTPLTMRLIEYGILAAVILGGYFAWHHKIFREGYESCQAAQTKAVEEGNKKYEKKSTEVHKLPDDALRNRVCQWMRDTDVSTCIKTLAPFSP